MKKEISHYIKSIKNKFIAYTKTNVLLMVFVITNLINAIILRAFTVKNVFAIKPILADTVVLLFISAFAYFFKPKKQFRYYIVWSIVFTAVCIINCVYYSNYISFASFSLLTTSLELGGYAGAIGNVLEAKQFIFLFFKY